MNRQDKLAIVAFIIFAIIGLSIGGRPLSDNIYTGLNGPTVNVIENPDDNSVTVEISNIQPRFKQITVDVGSYSETVTKDSKITRTDVNEGTKLTITGTREGNSSVYKKTQILYDDTISYRN